MQKAILAILALIFAAGFLTYTRIATVSSDPEVWHVDPIDAAGLFLAELLFHGA